MSPIDPTIIIVYLLAMVGVGVWFMRCNKSADDYFRGGGRLPWWVVSLSIYATLFSSIAFLSIPALTYHSDCRYFFKTFGILTGGLACLFLMGRFLPFVNGRGAFIGLVANYIVCFSLDLIPFTHKPHLLLYGFFGIVVCLIVAPLASLGCRERGTVAC